jgi:hypothetical protein
MRNLTIRTTVRSLLKELDKLDPGWYNTEVGGEYRKFEGNIYNTWGANMTNHEKELLKHVHTVYRHLLPLCYVDGPHSLSLYDNPDMYEDVIVWIESQVSELDGVWESEGDPYSGGIRES